MVLVVVREFELANVFVDLFESQTLHLRLDSDIVFEDSNRGIILVILVKLGILEQLNLLDLDDFASEELTPCN